jgi:hypothetical protein
MTSGFADERRAIEARFSSMYTTTTVKYENVSFSKPSASWVSLYILNTEARRITLGDSTQIHRFPGMIVVNIFTPEDEGTQEAREIADTVSDIFRDAQFSAGSSGLITCRTPSLDPVGTREGWYQVNVSTLFQRDKLI